MNSRIVPGDVDQQPVPSDGGVSLVSLSWTLKATGTAGRDTNSVVAVPSLRNKDDGHRIGAEEIVLDSFDAGDVFGRYNGCLALTFVEDGAAQFHHANPAPRGPRYEVAKAQRRRPKRDLSRGFANRGDFIVKQRSSINPDMVVDEIMRKWPATVAVVLRYRMFCVGCPIGTFHTVTEACREHQVDEADFLVDLEAAVRGER